MNSEDAQAIEEAICDSFLEPLDHEAQRLVRSLRELIEERDAAVAAAVRLATQRTIAELGPVLKRLGES